MPGSFGHDKGAVGTGLLVGSAGAFGASRLLSTLLFGVAAGMPNVVVGACCVMAMTSAVAAFVPAARAASVDPIQALRSE